MTSSVTQPLIGLLVAALLFAAGSLEAEAVQVVNGIEVRQVRFEGVESVDEERLRQALATRETRGWFRPERRFFDRRDFEADLRRIVSFYADRGFPDARITATDVRLSEAQDRVWITITVNEGEPVLIEDVQFVGFEVLPRDHFEELQRQVPIRPGAPRDRQEVQFARETATNELREHGYPYATVDPFEEKGVEPGTVRVTLQARPGTTAVFGPVEVVGNRAVDDDVIRRQLRYRPGDLFQLSRVRESQRRLYGLELFEFVNVEAVEVDPDALEIPTRVTVTEGDHRRLTLGLGYGTEERIRGDVQWRHVNFFGGARTAGVHGRWSSLSRGVRFDFNEPYLFHPDFSFGINGQRWHANEPTFELASLGGRATVTRFVARENPLARTQASTTVSLSLISEYEDYAITREALEDLTFRDELIAMGLDPRTGAARGQLNALALDFQRNTTANILDARAGYLASLHLEQAGWWIPGTFNYYEVGGELRHYVTLGRRAVLANRARFGTIDAPGVLVENVPFFKRFFLGGSTSLRGWGRFQVSPLSGAGLPIGGHTMLETSTELRFPVVGDIGGVLFLDTGNVWSGAWDIDLRDLRYAIGPGLRYNTLIGPVRFDLGYQLTPIEGLLVDGEPEPRRWRVHFSIGQAF